jgi:uncharacterized RDD family membrane protein YckC/DNA-binding transcriptional ArsR family regulator
MTIEQESVSKVLSVLAHPLRREILLDLSENKECSFTDLLNALKIDTGKLSFHLRALSSFVEQTSSGKYKLSRAGENAVRVILDVEGWAEAADVHGRSSLLPVASFRRRVGAFVIDFGLMLAITMTISFLPEIFLLSEVNFFERSGYVLFITIGLLWLYSTLLEGFNGQSLGKRVFRMKVVRTDGKKMSYDHAAVRNFGKVLPLLPFDLLLGLQLRNKTFLRYFDKFAGTTVIDLFSRIP